MYSAIHFCQSIVGLGGPAIAATSLVGLRFDVTSPVRAPGLASTNGAELLSPSGVPSTSTERPSSGEPPGKRASLSHRRTW
jgi:hypothetical protein